MRYTDKLNEKFHPLMVNRILRAYSKKMDRRFSHRPDLNKPVDEDVTRKHIELYSKLGLPCKDKWLRFYSNLTGVADYTYLPEDLYFARIERVLNDCNRAESEAEDKNLLSKFVDKRYQPRTILRFIRGLFYNEDYKSISRIEAEKILATDHGPLIGKVATESSGGHGVKSYKFVDGIYTSSDNMKLTCSWIERNFSNFLVQEQLDQCDFSKKFNPCSINTCRIITLRSPWDGNIIVTKAGMRFGVTHDIIDNMGIGGLGIGISNQGELGPKAYTYNDLKEFRAHPVTGMVFAGQKHPQFEKMCDVVVEQAQNIPNFNLISWDVIVDNNNEVKIIEVNLVSQGTDLPQFAYGSFFGDNTEKIIEWVADHLKYDIFKHFRTF